MEFWTQLYLKEGVARYMEFVAIDHLFPEWKAWTEFVQSVYTLALSLDALNTSHPVEVEVNHPDEINEIFDAISYAKGASLIRMVANYIGQDAFREGMKIYLQRFAYSNAVTNDLWAALEEAAKGKSVVDFMQPWTKVMGFPIIILQDDGAFKIARFLASGGSSTDAECPWQIPVTVQVQGSDEVEGPFMVGGDHESSALSSKLGAWTKAGKWVKLNVDQTGFFRVAYSPKQREALQRVLAPQTSPLGLTDRLGLISDTFAAGMAGYTSLVDALELVQDFGNHEQAGTFVCSFSDLVCFTGTWLLTCTLFYYSYVLQIRLCCVARVVRESLQCSPCFPIGTILCTTAEFHWLSLPETICLSGMGSPTGRVSAYRHAAFYGDSNDGRGG